MNTYKVRDMNETGNEAVSLVTEKRDRPRGRLYGQSNSDLTLDYRMRQLISEEVINAMANLTYEKKYALYLDIFKPLDFYELLFERRFKKTENCQQETEIL